MKAIFLKIRLLLPIFLSLTRSRNHFLSWQRIITRQSCLHKQWLSYKMWVCFKHRTLMWDYERLWVIICNSTEIYSCVQSALFNLKLKYSKIFIRLWCDCMYLCPEKRSKMAKPLTKGVRIKLISKIIYAPQMQVINPYTV